MTFHLWDSFPVVVGRVLESSVREEYQSMRSALCVLDTESPITRYALSENQK